MKTHCLFLLIAGAATSMSCSRTTEVAPTPTYDQATIALMNELAPQVVGEWSLHQVHLKAKPYHVYPSAPFPRDTTISQFATLAITPTRTPSTSPPDARYPGFDGTLTYRGTGYPVRFSLMASADYIVREQGPPAYFLLEYNFPIGSHQTTADERFLEEIGLIGDNYSLAIANGQTTMVWQGLNRNVERIELRK